MWAEINLNFEWKVLEEVGSDVSAFSSVFCFDLVPFRNYKPKPIAWLEMNKLHMCV